MKFAEVVKGILKESITVDQIFVGATFDNLEDDDMMTIHRISPKVYASGNDFDTEADTKEEMVKKLNSWKYRYIGVE